MTRWTCLKRTTTEAVLRIYLVDKLLDLKSPIYVCNYIKSVSSNICPKQSRVQINMKKKSKSRRRTKTHLKTPESHRQTMKTRLGMSLSTVRLPTELCKNQPKEACHQCRENDHKVIIDVQIGRTSLRRL